MTLPVDYANATVSLDNHPDAHNETNAAVNGLDTRVGDLEAVSPFVLLTGAGAPTSGTGTDGDYYLDTTNRVLYGPRTTGAATGESITVSDVGITNVNNTNESGNKITMVVAGDITGMLYRRAAANAATLTFNIWNTSPGTAGTLLGTVSDTRSGQTGQFTVNFGTPIAVTAGQVITTGLTASPSTGWPAASATPTVTSTANQTFVGFVDRSGPGYPTSISSGEYNVPVFLPTGSVVSWPIAVGGIVTFLEQTATPTNPTADTQILTYCKANKIVFAFNNAGTMRYKSLAMDAAGVTWVDHGSTPP